MMQVLVSGDSLLAAFIRHGAEEGDCVGHKLPLQYQAIYALLTKALLTVSTSGYHHNDKFQHEFLERHSNHSRQTFISKKRVLEALKTFSP